MPIGSEGQPPSPILVSVTRSNNQRNTGKQIRDLKSSITRSVYLEILLSGKMSIFSFLHVFLFWRIVLIYHLASFTVLVWKGLTGHTYLCLERKGLIAYFSLLESDLQRTMQDIIIELLSKMKINEAGADTGVGVERFIAHRVEKETILQSKGNPTESC